MTHRNELASKAFINGKIWTGEKNQKEVTAMATQGERILAIGDDRQIQRLVTQESQIIDLQRKRVLPGFNDAHVHFITGGFYLLGVNLRPARNAQEFRSILKCFAEKLPFGKWITGGDWDHEAWPEKKWPTKELIDDVTPKHPVIVNRIDMHMALANSAALRLARIHKDTPDPYGGTIERDAETGEPSGILIDNAMNLVQQIMPEPSQEEQIAAAKAAQEHAISMGVTSIHDIMATAGDFRTYQRLLNNDELKVRLCVYRPISFRKQISEIGIQNSFGNSWLRFGGVKVMADGALGARSALLYDPYSDDPTTNGLALQTKEELVQMVVEADAFGLQVALHAIGDKANTWALDAFEEAIKRNGRRDNRHRIEHAQDVQPNDLSRFAELGVVASIQPSHCIDDLRWAEKRIGDRLKQAYLVRSFVKNNTRMAFGTDWTVEPLNPMLGLYAAVTRESTEGVPKGGWFPEEKISLEQAIEFYTSGSAYAEFTEHEKGTLSPGKLADFVVLDKDIFSVPPKEILNTKISMTIVGGEIVYER